MAVTAYDADGEIIENVSTAITVPIDGIESLDGQIVLTSDDLYIPYGAIQAATLPPEDVGS